VPDTTRTTVLLVGLPPEASVRVVQLLDDRYGLWCENAFEYLLDERTIWEADVGGGLFTDPAGWKDPGVAGSLFANWVAPGPDLRFASDDATAGDVDDLAEDLRHLAETGLHPFAFKVVEEAHADGPGTIYVYVPWLGLWASDADGNGDPYVATARLLKLLDGPWWHRRRGLNDLCGRAWHQAFAELHASLAAQWSPPPA
jgi:hypothetical protein